MALPDFQTLMLPVLDSCKEGEVRIGDVVERLATKFSLSDDERASLLPSGRQTTFANRTHWAKSYLGKAGPLESTGRGRFTITQLGKDVLSKKPARIDIKFLDQFDSFKAFRARQEDDDEGIVRSDHAG